jgi:hypothetical protein
MVKACQTSASTVAAQSQSTSRTSRRAIAGVWGVLILVISAYTYIYFCFFFILGNYPSKVATFSRP